MYLSKVMISGPACRNPYEIHRVLWSLFPEAKDAARDFLFRVGRPDRNHAEILMQSERKPERSSDFARILGWKEYPMSLQEGWRLRFFLVANPIRTIEDEGGRKNDKGEPKKCRVPLVHEEEQRRWIERKLADMSTLESLAIDPVYPLRFRKGREERAGKIQPVKYQGVLIVKDPAAMLKSVQSGIGPAKAFGCGLLSLARA